MSTTDITLSDTSAVLGIELIDLLVKRVDDFSATVKQKKKRTQIFNDLFSPESGFGTKMAAHHLGAFEGKNLDFASFYLNLDLNSKIAVLNYIYDKDIDLNFPVFDDWKEYGQKYFKNSMPDHITENEIRGFCVGFNDKTKWDMYPGSLVWIDKFVLFSENTSIDGHEFKNSHVYQEFAAYPGDKYGNFINWSLFWSKASVGLKLCLVNHLFTYK